MTTRAGKRLLDMVWQNPDYPVGGGSSRWHEAVAAIEAEAAARERERIREAVEALRVRSNVRNETPWQEGFRQSRNETVATVLRLIDGEMS